MINQNSEMEYPFVMETEISGIAPCNKMSQKVVSIDVISPDLISPQHMGQQVPPTFIHNSPPEVVDERTLSNSELQPQKTSVQ